MASDPTEPTADRRRADGPAPRDGSGFLPKLFVWIMLLAIGLPLAASTVIELMPRRIERLIKPAKLFDLAPSQKLVAWSLAGWRSGAFQAAFSAWFTDHLQPRASVVRVVNQIYYSTFNRSFSALTVIGRDGYLFERGYINSYCHSGFDPAKLAALVDNLRKLQMLLRPAGHQLVFLLSPSKPLALPEFLPEGVCAQPDEPQLAASTLVTMLKEASIPVVDGPGMIQEMKANDPLPPFTVGGVHWSRLASARAASSLMQEITAHSARDLGAIALAEPTWNNPPRGADADLARLLNLLHPPVNYPTGDASASCRSTAAGHDADLLAIGGSFTNGVLRPIMMCDIFGRMDFFSYYTRVWFSHSRQDALQPSADDNDPEWAPSPPDPARLKQFLDDADIVLIELNESLLITGMPYLDHFLDDAIAALSGPAAASSP